MASWENLPAACLYEVFSRIPCAEDRDSAYRACPAWLNALNDCRPPKALAALPWLLLPAPNSEGSARLVCVLSGCGVHDHHFSTVIPHARCFGSHDGNWIFLAFRDPNNYELLNIRTGEVHALPGKMVIPDDPHHNRHPVKMIIDAGTLSSSPDVATCAAVFIVRAPVPPHYRYLALWQKGFSPNRNQPTSMFKVFRETKRPQMPDDADFPVAEFPWAWSEMDTLDGRILFVGYGFSRSYDADQYPGFTAGIYFLHDGDSDDEGVFFRDHNITPYACSDNGKYSDGRVLQCFPKTEPSDHSPPAWLLP